MPLVVPTRTWSLRTAAAVPQIKAAFSLPRNIWLNSMHQSGQNSSQSLAVIIRRMEGVSS